MRAIFKQSSMLKVKISKKDEIARTLLSIIQNSALLIEILVLMYIAINLTQEDGCTL